MSLLRFIRELLRVLWHEARFRYYRLAYRYVGHDHPDSNLIVRRLMHSQMIVNDWLRQKL